MGTGAGLIEQEYLRQFISGDGAETREQGREDIMRVLFVATAHYCARHLCDTAISLMIPTPRLTAHRMALKEMNGHGAYSGRHGV